MTLGTEIAFKFKGERDYVHGTDLYNAVLASIREKLGAFPSRISGTFHKFLRKNGILCFQDQPGHLDASLLYAKFSARSESITLKANIYEGDHSIDESYAYSESQVTEGVLIENGMAQMKFKLTYSYIEQYVAMTKMLHLTMFPKAAGKWLFTRFEFLDGVDPAYYPGKRISVQIGRNFINKISKCTLQVERVNIGHIIFSLGGRGPKQ